ncbi:SLBB domain-containing protein [Phocaeicola plebeius]|uniref:SLBB domain-containing protein n=1 Tax=Phocaeicola plebeius TaxID=310297 RepID=UPI0026F0086D|nr:SLBB domain-containing protein [Phocaeicola plebeius]MCI6051398.1 SLBB domain-containing protein [Phocaeicola plebeius]MDD6913354.1 SLBB domain-containing protein [Phocaeicola plebeius]MDY5977997.1 SLBB domain-containing protein [Phocaeicola plebeius]
MKLKALSLLVFMACSPLLMAQTGMTDQQVLEYVKQGMSEGKDQRQMATELARRGVTREQAERVKKLYEQEQGVSTSKMSGTELNEARLREATQEESNTSVLENPQPDSRELVQENQVFGRNIFNTRNLTFEPSVNIATPPNYRLGPGDEVIIDIWGTSQNTIRQQISPDGTINIEKIGPVNLSGMTVSEANSYLKRVLGKTYSGLDTPDGTLEIRLTLGNTRTIQINVMGEVIQPGTYALSSFSTVFHALYRAGGVSEIGSLRNVQVTRDGKTVAKVDVYDFIMKGKTQDDIRLQEGDVIIVPAYEALVQISGNVKRPMKFEMKKNETLATLISYAGGFSADAYTRSLRVVRQNGEEYEINTVKEVDYSAYPMRNGDVVTAEAILNRFTNKLEVRGAVYRPGIYQLNGEINTVRALVNEAKGLMGDAFTNRAVLQREREDLTTEIISVDVRSIMAGTSPDIPLQKNDILYIPSIHDLEERGDVAIYGEVAKPDRYSYSDNMTLEDLIIRAGGLRESASTVRVDVSRRIKDPKSTVSTDSIGQMFTFALKDGFVIDGQQGFTLQPYDQVFVRRSPGYQAQQNVQVLGEVIFGGTYAMTNTEERLSDLIKKAGGATSKAYLRGAKLTRVANEEEKKRMRDVINLMNRQFGEAMMDSLGIKVDSTFSVGIDLEKAVASPGSEYDLVLREGDVLSVPKLNNTVKVNGAVMMPNTVGYLSNKNANYYLDQAGGYALNAKKSKKFVIYMNGQVARIKGHDKDKIEPGCEIIVPSKKNKKVNAAEILSYATSFGSLATMFATITNLIKN